MKAAGRIVLILCACAVLLAVLGVAAGRKPRLRADFSARVWTEPVRAEAIVPPAGVIDVNGGDIYELVELPGIGETLARAIVEEREARGPFQYPEDLMFVRGIGEKRLEAIRDLVDVTGGSGDE